ncbi:MAG: hypothetical protein GOMPHAMPRED_002318 [Gomphillus americanus]|uniref:Uncharacterized protein n=1 Tax=Gomphillus americanus TaxID=1940652 RepID=A0A8H3IHY6_9LECA|nr:MAG: hypothetical protein GOMPHAMPRED_002318 [Gomphillus americanus]
MTVPLDWYLAVGKTSVRPIFAPIEKDPEFLFIILSCKHIVEATTTVEVQTESDIGGHVITRRAGEMVEQPA